jgi:hypothetical protein
MATVYVDLGGLDSKWTKACQKAITDLNTLFGRDSIKVVLTTKGPQAKEPGDNAGGDALRAGSIRMPPLLISPESIDILTAVWP